MPKKIIFTAIFILPLSSWAAHEQLPKIVIQGSKTPHSIFVAAPGSAGLKDTASLLEKIPGANVNRNGPLTGIAAYHGMYGNRVAVQVDGVNMKEVGPNSMDPPLSHIPAAMTDSLLMHKGIAPVSAGIESIGGSIKVKSRKGIFAQGDGIATHGNAASGYGYADNGYFSTLFASVANKNHYLHLGGSKEQGDNYKTASSKKQQSSAYDRDTFATGYGYQRGNHKFTIDYSDNATNNTGTPALPMDIEYVRGGLYDSSYTFNFADYQLKTALFYQKMRHKMSNQYFRNGGSAEQDAISNRTKVEAGGIRLALNMGLLDGDFTVGIEGEHANHDALITRTDTSPKHGGALPAKFKTIQINPYNDIEKDRYSIFGEWQGAIAERLSLQAGARFVHTWMNAGNVAGGNPKANPATAGNADSMKGLAIARRIGQDRVAFNNLDRKRNFNDVDLSAVLNYAITDKVNIELGLGRKNRTPSYQELYLFTELSAVGGLADGNTYLGDVDLDYETAYQFDLALNWHNRRAYISPRVFYHYVDNYIQGERTARAIAKVAMPGNPQNILEFANINAQLFGVDLEAGYTISDDWRIDAGINYVRGMRVDSPSEDDDLYRIAPLNGRLQLTYAKNDWTAALEGVFVADQGDVVGYGSAAVDESKTGGHVLVNLSGQYQPFTGVTIAAGVQNLIDTKYTNHLDGYQLHNRNGGRVAGHGRNAFVTLGYNW